MNDRDYMNITFQEGPVKEAGVNGCQVEDVIAVCVARLQELNVAPHGNRETSEAITHLQEVENWLNRRTRDREARGVEGTSEV